MNTIVLLVLRGGEGSGGEGSGGDGSGGDGSGGQIMTQQGGQSVTIGLGECGAEWYE